MGAIRAVGRTVSIVLGCLVAACLKPYGGGTIPPPPRDVPPAVSPHGGPVASSGSETPIGPRKTRTVTLRLLADERVRAEPQWRDKARAAVARASSYFQTLSFRFEVVDVATWETSPGNASLDRLLDLLEQQPKGGAEVIVGFVGGDSFAPGPIDRLGKARSFGGDAIVARWAPPDRQAVVLSHELLHLFGAVHVEVSGSVMRSVFDPEARRIDAHNEAIVDASRSRSFDREHPPLGMEDARRVLGAVERLLRDDRHNRDAEDARTDLIEYLRTLPAETKGAEGKEAEAGRLVAAGRAERSRGQHGRALAYFREAARMCPSCENAHLEMGREMLERGHLDDALEALHEEAKIQPRSAEAYYLIGLVHERASRAAQAREAYETALRLDPGHREARRKLGR